MAPRIQSSADLELPKRIGRYEAFLQIGAGGMARVYLAAHRIQGVIELVVVKELRPAAIGDADALVMFKDEAQIAMRLSHPNVIATRDVVASSPDYYLVMEYLEGKSLLEVLQGIGRDRMPLEDHVWILTQVLAGLEHAHELRDEAGRPLSVVHRDVSPSNVLLSYDGKVKLLDFGIAKASGSLSATHEGVVKGKLGYAAPEQCLGRPADLRSDIYAVGVMLWEAVAGRRRSQGETSQAVLQARILDSEPSLENVRPRAPLELVAVARRALAHDPEGRYATAREFREALELYLSWLPRPTGPAALATLLADHFEKDRKAVRAAIDAYCGSGASGFIRAVRPPMPSLPAPPSKPSSSRMSRPPSSVAPSLPPPLPSSLAAVAVEVEATPVEETEEDTSPIPVDDALLMLSKHDSVQPPPPPAPVVVESREAADPFRGDRRNAWIAVGIAAGVLGMAGAVFSFANGSHERPPEPAVEKPVPGASATAAAVEAAPAPSSVHVRIAVHPERAELRLDGLLLEARPYNGVQPRDGREHELTVIAEDYEPETRKLRFDQDVDLVVSLERTRSATTSRARTARAGRATATVPAAPPESRPASPRAEPGMDLDVRPGSRVKHSIDEKDPYAP